MSSADPTRFHEFPRGTTPCRSPVAVLPESLTLVSLPSIQRTCASPAWTNLVAPTRSRNGVLQRLVTNSRTTFVSSSYP
jgi:hypothetical protein